MRWLRGIPILAFAFSCGADHDVSRLLASREARYLLQSSAKLSDDFWKRLEDPDVATDFLRQRQAGWSFWSEMLQPMAASRKNFMVWQSWYGREDLQRIFRHLYQKLGPVGRRARRPFLAAEIQDGILWNDRLQFEQDDWDAQRFEQWFASFNSDEKQRSIPGMQKILFNHIALNFILQNYSPLELCQKKRQAHEVCEALTWPEQAVFLKTSWRRSEQGFLVERFATDASALAQQWQNQQWTADGGYEPDLQESLALRLPTGQKFHLTGLHASLRQEQAWYWTSLWLGQEGAGDLASDQPEALGQPWTNYRLCSVDGWHQPLRDQPSRESWPQPLAAVAQFLITQESYSWCSNPYLEPGPNNQKTNCTGCHQHAGLNWVQEDFRKRLTHDLTSLLQRSTTPGPADFVWSLFAGPEPLVQPLMDDIEFFDVYDPYQ